MSEGQFDDLDGFVAYAEKQFHLPLLAGCFASDRADPKIPSRARNSVSGVSRNPAGRANGVLPGRDFLTCAYELFF